ncbi:MAG: FIST N-terminal domain-containing protein [Leptolyngbyaceae cyanobacterium]
MTGTTLPPMQWASALSTKASLEAAVRDVIAQIEQQLSTPPDLGLVFISAAFASEYPRLLPLLHEWLTVPVLVGCSGGGVVGQNAGAVVEMEQKPALSLCLATLPGVTVKSFRFKDDDLPDLDAPPQAWIDLIGVDPAVQPQFVLLADPFSSGINDLLQGLDFAYPGAVKVGGLTSSGLQGSGSGLFCDRGFYDDGVVGIALWGDVVLDAVVAQGCRPIGQPYRVAEGERNIVLKLEADGDDLTVGEARPTLEVMQEMLKDMDEGDRKLAQHSLFIGIAKDGFKRRLGQGDFLIRNLLGVDPRVGAIAIGDRIRPGQRIQFHLRDARTSAEDLDHLLQEYQSHVSSAAAPPAGALMFACMGRGEGLYQEPNFDSQLLGKHLGQLPISGFFCNGEIGPIGDTTYLHGYTSVFGICRRPYEGEGVRG